MKKIDVLIGSLVYAVYMILSCVIIMAAEILAIKIINLFVVTDYLSLCIIRTVIYFVGVNTILAIVAYKEGHKAAFFSIPATLVSGGIAAVIHLIFALLFNFGAFAAGGVRFMTALIKFGSALNSNTFMGTLDRLDFIPFFALNSLIYIGVMILFGKLGAYRRLCDRQGLKGIDPNA